MRSCLPRPTTRSLSRSQARTRCYFGVYSPDVDPTSEQFDTEDDPTVLGERDDDGGPAQRVHEGRDAARRADPRVRRGRRRRLARAVPRPGEGQGRRVQGDVGAAEGIRRRPRLQLAAGRSEHRRARDRPRAARLQAGRRDPVLRLHLAGLHAAPERARDDALALEQQLLVAGRRAGRRTAATSAARSITRRRVRRCSRTALACAWSVRPPRSTRTACFARRSAATIP